MEAEERNNKLISMLLLSCMLIGSAIAYAAVKSDVWYCTQCRTTLEYAYPVTKPPRRDPILGTPDYCRGLMGNQRMWHDWIPVGVIVEEDDDE